MAYVRSVFSGVSTPTTVLRCFSFILFSTACVLLFSSAALAEWRVDFESKTVNPNDVGVTVDISASWDIPLTGLTVPVVVRQNTPGAFWTGALPYDTGGNGFTKPHIYNVNWYWTPNPFATIIEEFRPGVPMGTCGTGGDTGYDGIAPDHFVINATGTMSVPAQTGWKFLDFTFDVTGSPGTFEFDTACFSSSLFAIFMIDNQFPPINHGPSGTGEATFGKGVITIFGDVNDPPEITCPSDQMVNVTDLVEFNVTATDDGVLLLAMTAVDVPPWATYTDNGDNSGTFSGAPGCDDEGLYTIVFIADDGELADTCEVTIVVNGDADPPEAICPSTTTVGHDPGVCGANVSFTIDVTDNCPGATVTADPPSGTYFPIGTASVEVIATDAAGNADTCYFDVTVTNQPPSGTVPNRGFIYTSPYLEVLSDDIVNYDGDPITFSNLTITPTPPDNMPVLTDDEVSWAPSLNDALYNGGVYYLTVDASDGCDLVTFEWELYVTTISDKVEIGTASAQALTTGIILPIRIVTASPMWSIQLPLTARSVTGGAFWAGDIDTLPWEMVPEDAISNSRKFNKYPNFDRVSPDDFYLWGKAQFGQNHCLYPHDTAAYIRLRFDLNNNPGTFEIDTTFLPPLHTLRFLFCESIAAIVPAFIKGIVTVEPCDCPLNGDWNCDGRIDPIDVVYMVNYVYRTFGQEPCNPGNCFQNGDVNCDHYIDPLDCVYLVAWVYRPGTPPPCDPCTEW